MQQESILDDFIVIKTLGRGATAKVKLVKDQQGSKFAAKIMNIEANFQHEKFKDMIKNEAEILMQINHQNVVKFVNIEENGEYYSKKTGEKKKVQYILMEFCERGEVFEYLYQTGSFSNDFCKFYFKQLLDGIEALHSKGIAHRDLKSENLLFDKNFNLKISDFGYATYLNGHEDNEILKSQIGTEAYMAPEIHLNKGYKGIQVDIFATGVVLFIMKAQNPPFVKASLSNQLYKTFQNKYKNHGF